MNNVKVWGTSFIDWRLAMIVPRKKTFILRPSFVKGFYVIHPLNYDDLMEKGKVALNTVRSDPGKFVNKNYITKLEIVKH